MGLAPFFDFIDLSICIFPGSFPVFTPTVHKKHDNIALCHWNSPFVVSMNRSQFNIAYCYYCFYNPLGMFFMQPWGLLCLDSTHYFNQDGMTLQLFRNFCLRFRIGTVQSDDY